MNPQKSRVLRSIEDLKNQCFEGPVENILEWLQGSLESPSSSEEPDQFWKNSFKNP